MFTWEIIYGQECGKLCGYKRVISVCSYPDSKVHGANMGPILGLTGPRWAPCWPHELCYLGSCKAMREINYQNNFLVNTFPFCHQSMCTCRELTSTQLSYMTHRPHKWSSKRQSLVFTHWLDTASHLLITVWWSCPGWLCNALWGLANGTQAIEKWSLRSDCEMSIIQGNFEKQVSRPFMKLEHIVCPVSFSYNICTFLYVVYWLTNLDSYIHTFS